MKLFWTGTDALMMVDLSKRILRKRPFWLFMRMVVRFLDRHVLEGHITNCALLQQDLLTFGVKKPIEVRYTPVLYPNKYPKKEHPGFNVLYYKPHKNDTKFRDWLYGIDLIDQLKKDFPGVTFIEVGRGQDSKFRDMSEVYPLIDFYVRPNRHDGLSRMVRECEINDIPYYWSQACPDYNEMKKQLNYHYYHESIRTCS